MSRREIGEYKRKEVRKEQPRVKLPIIQEGEDDCYVCGNDCTPILHLHHIKEVKDGGDNSRGNVVMLCPNCHSIVHSFLTGAAEENYGLDFLVHWMNKRMSLEGIDKVRELWTGRIKVSRTGGGLEGGDKNDERITRIRRR